MPFSFKSKVREFQSDFLLSRAEEFTNAGLIKSESEFKLLIEDLLSKVSINNESLTEVESFKVVPRENVDARKYKDLILSVEADLKTLYKELTEAKTVISVNDKKSRATYRLIKGKIASMKKQLNLLRQKSFDVTNSVEAFLESFIDSNQFMFMSNTKVDQKTGKLQLKPSDIISYNESFNIDKVELSILPTDNKKNGVIFSHHFLNDPVRDYKSGDRNIFKSGLWKVQLLTSGVPRIEVSDIAGRTKFNGVLMYLDIFFTGHNIINKLELDPYGEYELELVEVQYKPRIEDAWRAATRENTADRSFTKVNASSSDIIIVQNIVPFNAKGLRLIFFQDDGKDLNKVISEARDAETKVIRDLEQRRFLITETEKEQDLDKPLKLTKSPDEASVYEKVISEIEKKPGIKNMQEAVLKILAPDPEVINLATNDYKLYEAGLWSMSPQLNVYGGGSNFGLYISHNPTDENSGYSLEGMAPTQVKLAVNQETPASTSIDWYILNDKGDVQIPILPDGDVSRMEANGYITWELLSKGTQGRLKKVFLTDFPQHPNFFPFIRIFKNGREVSPSGDYSSIIEDYNSRTLFVPSLGFTENSIYTIDYSPSKIETVECWIIKKTSTEDDVLDIQDAVVFARKEKAQDFIDQNTDSNGVSLSDKYIPERSMCHLDEYSDWFLNGSIHTFIDLSALSLIGLSEEWKQFSTFAGGTALDTFQFFRTEQTRASWLRGDPSAPKPVSEGGDTFEEWHGLAPSIPIFSNKLIENLDSKGGTNVLFTE